MDVATEGRTGEDSPGQLVSPLELMLDAAVESERHRWAIVREAGDLADQRTRPTHAALAVGDGARATNPQRARDPAPMLASPPARRGAWAKAQPQRPPSEVTGWVRCCAVALGLLALLTAFRLPVSPTSPARTPSGELGAPTHAPAAPAEAATRESAARHPPGSEAAPVRPESAAPHSGALSTPPDHSAPSNSSWAPAALQVQPGVLHVNAKKRPGVVTVDDLFGVGGNEPLPPEALDAPASPAPLPPRTVQRTRRAPASSSLFYHSSPF